MMAEANKDKKPGEKRTPPPGYKSALGRARDAQKAADAKAKAKPKAKAIKAIAPAYDEDTASDDSDSDSDFPDILAAVRPRFTKVTKGTRRARATPIAESPDVQSVNSFSGLVDDVQLGPWTIAAVEKWAHKTNTEAQNKMSQKEKKLQRSSNKIDRISNYIQGPKKADSVEQAIIINNEKDIDQIAPMITPLPAERKKINKILQKVAEINLLPGERLCLVDSGSFTHAIDAEEDLPEFDVIPLKDSQLGRDGESASGEIMKRLGKVKTEGTVEGMPLALTWDVMKVKVPIISVRKLVRDLHSVHFKKHGGYIKDLRTGNRMPFFEYQGVYYVKYRVSTP